jgi:hypothetical protein
VFLKEGGRKEGRKAGEERGGGLNRRCFEIISTSRLTPDGDSSRSSGNRLTAG